MTPSIVPGLLMPLQLGYKRECQGLNPGQLRATQMPYLLYYYSSPYNSSVEFTGFQTEGV